MLVLKRICFNQYADIGFQHNEHNRFKGWKVALCLNVTLYTMKII